MNCLNWPYSGPVVLDGDKTIFVIAESICCSEWIDGYVWVMRVILEMAPKRKTSSITYIFGDGILEDSLLDMLGIRNTCNIGLDVYHMLEVDWPKNFGNFVWDKIWKDMKQMIYARSEEGHMSSYLNVKDP